MDEFETPDRGDALRPSYSVIGQDIERQVNPDDRRKPGQVELELWKCNNLGTQGDERRILRQQPCVQLCLDRHCTQSQ